MGHVTAEMVPSPMGEVTMSRLLDLRVWIAAASCLVLASGCGATADDESSNQVNGLKVVVGNSPGGGYDTMARQIAEVMESEEIATDSRVMNVSGAGGTVALQQLVNSKGDEDTLMTTGVAVTGSVLTNESPVTVGDTAPIARVLEEPMIIAVDGNSEYKTLDDLIRAWRKDPAKITAAGGTVGGPDYQQVMLLAQAVGIDPKSVNFVSYDGGGELLPALLGGKVAFTASGYAEWADQIDSGEIRVLAVSSKERLEAVDAPTLQEEGVDLVFANWRGYIAPPGIGDERREELADVFEQLHKSDKWQETLQKNGRVEAPSTKAPTDEIMLRSVKPSAAL